MTVKRRPMIAITMGDAAGIGSEIIVKALQSKRIYSTCYPLVVGEGVTMSEVIRSLNSPLKLRPVKILDDVKLVLSVNTLHVHTLICLNQGW